MRHAAQHAVEPVVQPWYLHISMSALPSFMASGPPRCRHTLKNARSAPSFPRTTMIGSPATSGDHVVSGCAS